MGMKKIKHSKFKNTAIIFELLTRQITVDVLENRKSKAMEILKKYFNKKNLLSEELLLYNYLKDKKAGSESESNYYINSVIKARKRLDESKLKHEKYNIIKEIKENYDIDSFFSTNIENYKILASIYKLFESVTNLHKNYNPTDPVQSRYVIIENMISPFKKDHPQDNTLSEMIGRYRKQDKEIRQLSYKLLVEQFNKKYGKLDVNQRAILRKYIDNLSNTNKLREYVNLEVPKIKRILKIFAEKTSNQVVRIKLEEMINHLDKLKKSKIVKDNQLVTMLKLYELIRETKKVIK